MKIHIHPPSVNNIPTRQKKANRTKKNSSSPSKKAGAKIGHVGVSNTRKSDYTKIHKPKKCAKCGSKYYSYKNFYKDVN